jgi:hypothetical protein
MNPAAKRKAAAKEKRPKRAAAANERMTEAI